MKKIIIALCIPVSAYALFNYDRAILEGQKGNWQQSSTLLKNSLIQKPDRADLLYDLGVSTYKTAEYDKALAYFNQSAHNSTNKTLTEQALFNAGNTHVQLKQLHEAIDAYDTVLASNPEHTKAKHNKEVVQKMLEQQKQKEDEEKKEQENKNDTQDKEQNKEQNKNNQQDEQKKQDNKDSDQQNSKDDQQSKKQNDNQEKNDRDNKSQQEEKNEQEQRSQPDQKKQGQQKENEEPGTQPRASGQEQQQNHQGPNEQKLTPALARILKEQEKKDADLNKKMIKAMAGTQKGSSHGSNSW